MANDGSVKIGTELDKSGLQKGIAGLGGYAQKGFAIVSDAAAVASKAITVAVGAASTAITALGTAAIKGYSDYEQLVGGIETLFGAGGAASVQEYADAVGKSVSEVQDEFNMLMESQNLALKNASEAYKTAGMSANEYMEVVTGFAASLKQSTENELEAAEAANQAVIDMADNANKMGTNMESIQNAYQGFAKQNYTMLDNLKLGYGGTKEEMQRLLKDAEKITGIKYDISNLSDVYSAIHIIQTELGITGTTAKEASSTIAGSMKAAKSAWANLVVGIADDTQDFDKLVDDFVDSVIIAADNLLPRIETSLDGIGKLAEKLLPEIVDEIPLIINDILPNLVQSGVDLIDSLVEGIEQNFPQVLSAGTKILASLGQGILTSVGTFSNIGINIIQNIVASLSTNLPQIVSKGNELVTSLAQGVTENLPGIIQSGVQIVSSLIEGFAQMLPNLLSAAVDGIIALAMSLTEPNTLINLINSGIELITSLVEGLVEALPKLLEAAPVIIANLVTALIAEIPQLLIAAAEVMLQLGKYLVLYIANLLEAIPKIFSQIKENFSQLDWKAIGQNIIEGITTGVKNAASNLVDAAVSAAKDAVEAVKGWLGIASPSKLTRDIIGKNMIAGIGVGIELQTPKAINTAEWSVGRVVNAMQERAYSAYPEYREDSSFMQDGPPEKPTGDTYNEYNYNFYEPVETPDETARAIRKMQEFGLAGA